MKLRRWAMGLVSALGFSIAGMALGQQAAQAAVPVLGCKWSTTAIKYYANASATGYNGYITTAAGRWAGLDGTLTNTSSGYHFRAFSENRGNTVGWSGIFRQVGTVTSNATSSPGCVGGVYQSGKLEVVLNTYYVDTYPTSPKNWRVGVAAHEFGHVFGLAHNDPTLLCSGYQVYHLMSSSDNRFNSACADLTYPQSDEKAQVNVLY